ncbi:MAG: TPM domain-containing protein [Thermoplasmatota archaeon]
MKWASFLPAFMILFIIAVPSSAYPKLEYYVTDQVGVLTESDIYDIEDICIEAHKEKGVEMAVLIVNTTEPDDITMYAVKTFEESGIGQKGKDNGLLLLISVSKKEWRIEVGYGLEGVLTDILVNQIAQEHLVPFLEVGNYYEGILYTMAFLGREILDNYEGGPPRDDSPWHPIPFIPLNWWQLLISIIILIAILSLTGGRLFFWIGGSFGRSGGGFGGGRSGGGGARGRF